MRTALTRLAAGSTPGRTTVAGEACEHSAVRIRNSILMDAMLRHTLRIALAAGLVAAGIAAAGAQKTIPYRVHAKIGFGSQRSLNEHYRKHGREFGKISREEYLLMAQDLRDRPLDMKILEAVRRDGVITRFDRRTRAFIAFERNLIIRTFLKPAGGEKYFHRQLRNARRRR